MHEANTFRCVDLCGTGLSDKFIVPEDMSGNGYYKIDSHTNVLMQAAILPSGELAAVWINPDSVQWDESSKFLPLSSLT